ncbi:hypothetical protein TRFO_04656 [Tritrichomonas foetus]|uniref:Uncharacterized protein n=1 Tax=Tritrichomonas foetus TaxID=1144522 RepID=A0A1J4KIF2_9EUKA|nr:hypothetical protein TRFO_04656 [Tritrichomonas foetus]|eukprot:OHT09077.1 hypothetical protein TRFO_04656 [Tritrichomonas foetus]
MTSEKIIQYGRALLQYGGIIDKPPSITIPNDKLHELFDSIVEKPDEAFLTGFFAIFTPTLHSKLETFTSSQIATLKSDLIRCCNVKFPTLLLSNYFMNIVGYVYKFVNHNHKSENGEGKEEWPELLSFIFHESKNNENSGFLLSKVIRYLPQTTPQELEKMRTQVFNKVCELIPAVPVPVKIRLLYVFCDIQGFTLTAPFWSLFWKTAIECVKEEEENEVIIWNAIKHFGEKLDDNEKFEPPRVDRDEDYLDSLTFIGILSTIDFARIIQRVIGIVAKNFSELPMNIFQKLRLVNSRKISNEKRQKIIEILKNANEEKKNLDATFFVVLPFLPEAIHKDTKLEDLGITSLDKYAIGSSIQQQLWCRAIIILTKPLTTSKLMPPNTQMTIMSMSQSENTTLSSLAFDALKSLFECFVVTELEAMRSIFIVYDKLNNIQKVKFIRSIQILVESGGFDSTLLQPIEDFIRNSLKSTNDLNIQSACMSLVSSLGTINTQIIASYVKEMQPLITTAVNSKKPELMPDAAHLLLLFSMVQPALNRRTLANLYPKLLAFVKSDGNDEERARVGESIAGLVDSTLKKKELPEAIAITTLFLQSKKPILVIAATKMIQIYSKLLTQSVASPLYSDLARASLYTKNEKAFNRCIDCMKKLFKQFQMNPNMSVRFSFSLLTEDHSFFVKVSIWDWICTSTSMFPFVTLVIEKIPKEVSILLPIIHNICENSNDEMFTLIFDTIAAAFSVGLVKELPSERLYEVCYKDVFNQHSTISLSYVIEKITDELHEFTEKLQEEYHTIKDDNLLWKCAVSDALIQLVSRGQTLEPQIFETILSEFPYKAEFGFSEDFVYHLMDAFKNNEKGCRRHELTYVKVFSDFLMLDKTEILTYRIGYELQMEMKADLRRIVRGNKDIEKEMMKYYNKDKTKLNSFFSFIQ